MCGTNRISSANQQGLFNLYRSHQHQAQITGNRGSRKAVTPETRYLGPGSVEPALAPIKLGF